MKISSIIRDSDEIYMALSQRKKELGLSNLDIFIEANNAGIKAPRSLLSNYFNRNTIQSLTEEAILWMCDRYGVEVQLVVKLNEYNEFNALLKTKVKYGKE